MTNPGHPIIFKNSAKVFSSRNLTIICREFGYSVYMYELCWVQMKNIFYRDKFNLDQLLVGADSLFKSLSTANMHPADQLPEFVKLFSHNIPIRYGRPEIQLSTLINSDIFKKWFSRNYCRSFVFAIYR